VNGLSAWIVWCLPLLVGSGLWAACAGWPRRGHDRIVALAGGWIVGALVCGLLVRVLAASELFQVPSRVGTAAALIGLAGWIVAWRRRSAAPPPASVPFTRGEWALAAGVLLLLGWRGWIVASDILLHPTLPWDAWAIWQAKAKAWVLAGQLTPYVSFEDWLSAPAVEARTAGAWSYPELLPWTLVWFAGGSWIEPSINLAWFGLWGAMLFAQYGQWRALDVPRFAALAGVYLLGSLPLLNAHAALGGYADLWLAALLSLGMHAWLRWRRDRDARQLLIVLGILPLLPIVKLEGAAWSIVLGAACVFGALPEGLRAKRFAIGLAVAGAAIAASLVLGVAWIAAARHYAGSGPALAPDSIGQSIAALSNALWGQWNWNLLWFALPVALVWNARAWRRDPTARRLLVLLAIPLALIFGLFVFTTASRYAQSYSAVNRLLLQMTPLLVASLLFALWPANGRGSGDQAGVARTASA
jgi:hypothetical protein